MAPSSYIAATADAQQQNQAPQKSLKYISGYDNEGNKQPEGSWSNRQAAWYTDIAPY